MITQRLRGLINLHSLIVSFSSITLFLAYANAIPIIRRLPGLGFLDLSKELTLMPYLLCLAGAMAFSTRYLNTFASRFHRITWVDSAQIALKQTSSVAAFIFAFMFAMKDRGMSRLFLGTYLCLFWCVGLFLNKTLPHFLSRMFFGVQQRVPTLVVGELPRLAAIQNWLATKNELGMEAIGYISRGVVSDEVPALPYLGPLNDLERIIREKGILQVILLSLPTSPTDGLSIIEICQISGCRLLIHNNLADILHHPLIITQQGSQAFYSLQDEPLEDPINRVLKRSYDILVSVPVVLLLLPLLFGLVWIMQAIQAPGRLLFRQLRGGQRGNRFFLLKFRSMFDVEQSEAEQARQAHRADKRVFRFGQFMRRSSIDEFPQFINVLFGQMSVVGPRPHMIMHDSQFSTYYRGYSSRKFAKPGITGLAQVRGLRGEISDPAIFQERIASDLEYIANWSIWLDLQVTLRTIRQVILPPSSAY